MRVISGSLGRKLVALVIAVTGIVFLYETRIIDSTALQSLLGDDRPAAVPIEEGVQTLALALAARRSAEANRPVAMVE